MTEQQKKDLVQQCVDEYKHAREYRRKREDSWLKVDELYFGKKKPSLVSRANIHIPMLHGSVETLLGKINKPPFIEYAPVEEGDKMRTHYANALMNQDRRRGLWDLKDVLSKKEAILYGRTIMKKWSVDSKKKGFQDFLEVVDVLDFLIDPLAGGLTPFENARFCGQDNIIRTKYELQDDIYDKEAVKEIVSKLTSDSQGDDRYRARATRRQALGLSEAVYISDDAVKLTEWYTTFEGEKYYVLFSMEHQKAVRIELLADLFESDEFPFSSWACFPSLFEFWTPSPAELFKEINIVQNVIVSQLLDNNAMRNYGMRVYDKTKLANPALLDARPQGKVPVTGKPQDVVMDLETPSIVESLNLLQSLNVMYDRETGITTQAKGVPHSKRMSATEFSGLLDEVAERIYTTNILYQEHYRRIAKLYLHGLAENLSKERAIRVLGANGYEWAKVTKKDLGSELDIEINIGLDDEAEEKVNKDKFFEQLPELRKNPRVNQAFLDEKEAEYLGFTEDEVERFLNPELEGDWMILSEAAAENEQMLAKEVMPNTGATTGHIEKHFEYIKRTSDLDKKIADRILKHALAELPHAAKNAEMNAKKMLEKMKAQEMQQEQIGSSPAPAQPAPMQQPAPMMVAPQQPPMAPPMQAPMPQPQAPAPMM